jgi:hypothetical protein
LNPIEHAWAKLKEMIYQLDPDIENYQGSIGDLKDRFNDLIECAWEGLGQEYFDKLIESMRGASKQSLRRKGGIPNIRPFSPFNTMIFEIYSHFLIES